MSKKPPHSRYPLRDRITRELNDAGVLEWEDAPRGSPQHRERADTAIIQLVRIVQTLALEIDRLRTETGPRSRAAPKSPS